MTYKASVYAAHSSTGQRGVTSDIATIRIQNIDTADERMLRSDLKYRFVIDLASLNEVTAA